MSDWPFQSPWHLLCEEREKSCSISPALPRALHHTRQAPQACREVPALQAGAEGVHNPPETSTHAVSFHYSSWRHSMRELQRLMWICRDRQDCAALWVTPTVASLLPPGDWPSLSSWKPQLIHWENIASSSASSSRYWSAACDSPIDSESFSLNESAIITAV